MAASRVIQILFNGDASGLNNAAGEAESTLSKFNNAAVGASLAVVGAAGLIGAQAIQASSAVEQAFGGVDAVFGANAQAIKDWANNTTDNIRIPAAEVGNFAVGIGAQLKNAGVPMDQLGAQTQSMISIGADFAAMYGGTAADAVGALSAGLRGEFDSLDRYGLSINQAAIDAKVLAMGLDTSTVEAEKNAKAVAYMALLNEQGADALGAAGRESSSFGAQMESMNENMEAAKVALGDVLMPYVKEFGNFVRDVIIPTLKEWGPFLIGAGIALTGLAVAVLAINGALIAYRAISTAVTAAQWLMNSAFFANPFFLVVVAIAALVAAFVMAYRNSETFRNIVNGAFEAVKAGIGTAVNVIKGILGWFGSLPGLFSGWIGGARNAIVNGFTSAVNWVAGIPGRIMGVLGNLGGMLANSGRALVDGFLRGIMGAWNGLMSRVRGLMGTLRGLWPFSPAKDGPFSGKGYVTHSGKALTSDFADSLRGGMPNVIASARELMDATSMELQPASVSGNASTGTNIASNGAVAVNVYIDGQEFKGMIRTAIAEDNRQTRRGVGAGAGRGV